MTASASSSFSKTSWSSFRCLRNGAPSIYAPTPATEGAELPRSIGWHGYTPHVFSRPKEAQAKRRNPTQNARRWVVEVAHSWFNQFRKLPTRHEKLHRSFMALTTQFRIQIALLKRRWIDRLPLEDHWRALLANISR
jgi:hypothetical protein